MKTNTGTGQIRGPFTAGYDIYSVIKQNTIPENFYIKHLGVETINPFAMKLNEKLIELNNSKIYEINNVKIKAVTIETETDNNTIITYTIEEE